MSGDRGRTLLQHSHTAAPEGRGTSALEPTAAPGAGTPSRHRTQLLLPPLPLAALLTNLAEELQDTFSPHLLVVYYQKTSCFPFHLQLSHLHHLLRETSTRKFSCEDTQEDKFILNETIPSVMYLYQGYKPGPLLSLDSGFPVRF